MISLFTWNKFILSNEHKTFWNEHEKKTVTCKEVQDVNGSLSDLLVAIKKTTEKLSLHLYTDTVQRKCYCVHAIKHTKEFDCNDIRLCWELHNVLRTWDKFCSLGRHEITVHPIVCFYNCNDTQCEENSLIEESLMLQWPMFISFDVN